MGVSGCGKTTVGKILAKKIKARFIEGDDMHPPENVEKMRGGNPLNDEDRQGWLDNINKKARAITSKGEDCVIACSALKRQYRMKLREGLERIVFVYLKGAYDFIFQRMQSRKNHFMPAGLLQSQFETLEEPDTDEKDIITIQIWNNSNEVAAKAAEELNIFFNAYP
jgi:gluconokinase